MQPEQPWMQIHMLYFDDQCQAWVNFDLLRDTKQCIKQGFEPMKICLEYDFMNLKRHVRVVYLVI